MSVVATISLEFWATWASSSAPLFPAPQLVPMVNSERRPQLPTLWPGPPGICNVEILIKRGGGGGIRMVTGRRLQMRTAWWCMTDPEASSWMPAQFKTLFCHCTSRTINFLCHSSLHKLTQSRRYQAFCLILLLLLLFLLLLFNVVLCVTVQ